jgi:hypothetical protein
LPNAGNIYALGMQSLVTTGANLTSGNLKMALVNATYTPDLVNDQWWSTVQPFEFAGPGYTAGGNILTGPSVNISTPATWPLSYPAAATAVATGTVIKSGNYLYRSANSGSAAASPPVFPTTEGDTVTDASNIVWTNIGSVILVFNVAGGFVWSSISTQNVPYAVIYDTTTDEPPTEPLLVLLTFSPPMTNIPAGPVTINPDPYLGYLALPLF